MARTCVGNGMAILEVALPLHLAVARLQEGGPGVFRFILRCTAGCPRAIFTSARGLTTTAMQLLVVAPRASCAASMRAA